MEENNYKPQIPDVMEAIFDAAYLIFDLVAAILFFTFSKGNILFVLYGILTLTLCGGDAFHLVPRIIRAVRGSDEKIKRKLGIGLQVSSVTMTVFYIILMYVWKFTFPEMIIPTIVEAVVWISAVVRIVICMFPQNNWCTDEIELESDNEDLEFIVLCARWIAYDISKMLSTEHLKYYISFIQEELDKEESSTLIFHFMKNMNEDKDNRYDVCYEIWRNIKDFLQKELELRNNEN